MEEESVGDDEKELKWKFVINPETSPLSQIGGCTDTSATLRLT
jgi:hypothetical protein